MLHSFLGSSSEVIQVSEDDASNIMENISHGTLERSTNVFESKGHDLVSKSTPWGSKCSLILICWIDLDLIVAKEPIHEGKGLVANTIIDNLVDERCWEVVFGTSMIDIMKVGADANSALLFVNMEGVGDPRGVCDGVYEPYNA
jgi:hypothetical protein